MSRIYYKQALYMKKWLKRLILLTFVGLGALKRLFLGHEEHPGLSFYSIYRYFHPGLQQEIRLSGRLRSVKSGQKRQL